MDRSTLLVAVGAALGGIAVTMGMLAVVYQPVLLFVALPFAGAGYLVWYQGTGRLAERMRRQAARAQAQRAARERTRAGDGGTGTDTDGGPRWADAEFGDRRRRAREGARGRGPFAGRGGPRGSRRTRAPPPGVDDGPSVEEAYRRLDLPPGSDPDEVRDAYRSKVKDVHPDTEHGDEESFKEVNEAYETLQERVL